MIDNNEEIEAMKKREMEIYDRVDKLHGINENLILIYRIDLKQTNTFLATDSRARLERLRESWYGKICLVSPSPSGDEVKELKKSSLKRGDVVSYNPESAYSLNIAEFPEIWVVHIDNILVVDYGYDPILAKEAAIKRRFEQEQEFMQTTIQKAEMIQRAQNMMKANNLQIKE